MTEHDYVFWRRFFKGEGDEGSVDYILQTIYLKTIIKCLYQGCEFIDQGHVTEWYWNYVLSVIQKEMNYHNANIYIYIYIHIHIYIYIHIE